MATQPFVLLINPNTSTSATAMMERILRDALPPSIGVGRATAARGVAMITSEPEMAIAIEVDAAIAPAAAGLGPRFQIPVIDAVSAPPAVRFRAC